VSNNHAAFGDRLLGDLFLSSSGNGTPEENTAGKAFLDEFGLMAFRIRSMLRISSSDTSKSSTSFRYRSRSERYSSFFVRLSRGRFSSKSSMHDGEPSTYVQSNEMGIPLMDLAVTPIQMSYDLIATFENETFFDDIRCFSMIEWILNNPISESPILIEKKRSVRIQQR
jgi:hypothetical protein